MIELFRQMLVGVSVAAVCGGVAMTLSGRGALHEITRLAVGITVLLAVLDPLSSVRIPDWSHALRTSVRAARVQSQQMQVENEAVLSSSAMDVTCRYIKERAAQMGVVCHADLDLAKDADGILVVTGAHMTCDATDADTVAALQTMVAEECGIPREMQTWNWNE